MLKDIRAAVQKAIDEGTTLRDFQKELKPLLKQKGWWGRIPDPKNPEKEIQLGSVRRLEKIFDINVRTAYQTGRYNDLAENAKFRPYWQYIAVMDDGTRKEHKSLHGKVFRWDDPFWDTFFPPNGWNCRCTVKSLSERELKQRGLTVEKTDGKLLNATATLPNGQKVQNKVYKNGLTTVRTDVGWNYNPGKAAYQPMDDGKDPILRKSFESIVKNIQDKQSVNGVMPEISKDIAEKNVYYKEVTTLDKPRSIDEITLAVGGGDCTSGSCSSAALAYLGQRAGYNVLDFRGGDSRAVFARRKWKIDFAERTGGIVINDTNGIKAARIALSFVKEGKEYYFSAGRHTAIVRKNGKNFEYLELQSSLPGPRQNWFKKLTIEKLKDRFDCRKEVSEIKMVDGQKRIYIYEQNATLIESSLLTKDPAFKSMLGYINTAESEQLKGDVGEMK